MKNNTEWLEGPAEAETPSRIIVVIITVPVESNVSSSVEGGVEKVGIGMETQVGDMFPRAPFLNLHRQTIVVIASIQLPFQSLLQNFKSGLLLHSFSECPILLTLK